MVLLWLTGACNWSKKERPDDLWTSSNRPYAALDYDGKRIPPLAKRGPGPAPLPERDDIAGPPKAVPAIVAEASVAQGTETASGPAEPPPPSGAVAAVNYVPHPIVEALRAYMEDRPKAAVEHLGAYEKEDQELLLQMLPIIAKVDKSGMFKGKLSVEEQATLIEIFRSCLCKLQKSAPLQISKLVLCREVMGFGVYLPVTKNQFRPGDVIYVYAELQNLIDSPEAGGISETRLSSALEIRHPAGEVVWSEQIDGGSDRSLSPRNDHFGRIRFPVPDLPPGYYMLRVRIVDAATQREAVKTVDFRIETMATASRPLK